MHRRSFFDARAPHPGKLFGQRLTKWTWTEVQPSFAMFAQVNADTARPKSDLLAKAKSIR
jgi:hypothetical protein